MDIDVEEEVCAFDDCAQMQYTDDQDSCGTSGLKFEEVDIVEQFVDENGVQIKSEIVTCSPFYETESPSNFEIEGIDNQDSSDSKICKYSSEQVIVADTVTKEIEYNSSKNKQNECYLCAYNAKHETDLERHIESMHSNVKQHKCPLCEYSTNRKVNIKNHIDSVHLNFKQHKCHLCDYASNTKYQLKQHIDSVHLSLKRHLCHICDYVTARRINLKRHMDSVHLNLKQHICHLCDYASETKSHLEEHIDSVHFNSKKHNNLLELSKMAKNQVREFVASNENPDVVHFLIDAIRNLSDEDRLFLKNMRRPCPKMSNLIQKGVGKQSDRSFNGSFWFSKFRWLTGSATRNKLYCWYCLLFSDDKKSPWVTTGYDNIKELSRSLSKHEASRVHMYSALKFKLFGTTNIQQSNDSICKKRIDDHNKLVRNNREIIRRLIDIILYLAHPDLPFHDHDKKIVNQGNFLELVKFLSCYDDDLRKFLDDSSDFAGLSDTVRNELIESINEIVLRKLYNELENCVCFSWQIDESNDIFCFPQLSLVVRYVFEGKVKEHFLGFHNVSTGRTAEDLFKLLSLKFKSFDLKHKLIGHTYDRAVVMAGELKSLHLKIDDIAPQALLVHCYDHRLNLILQDASCEIRDCKLFLSDLTGFSSFFSKSTKRINLLDEICKKRLLKNSETQLNFKSGIIQTVLNNRLSLIETFEFILSNDEFENDKDAPREAHELITVLNKFNFNFLLLVFNKIFQKTEILQSSSSDIKYCNSQIQNLLKNLTGLRSHDCCFDDIYMYNVTVIGPPARKRVADNPDDKLHFKRMFNEILDVMINQIHVRFQNLSNLGFCELLNKSKFQIFRRTFPTEALDTLFKNYPLFFDKQKLENELTVFYSDPEIFGNGNDLSDLLYFIFKHSLQSDVPEIYKLLSLMLSLPATSVPVEGSFSALKRIKTFTRNTMSRSRPRNLALISIEKKLVKEMAEHDNFFELVIDHFAAQKDRSIELHYK